MSTACRLREFDVLSIFPGIFPGPLAFGVTGKALEREIFRLRVHDLRAWADPPHRQVDDAPFGGGAGMVFKPEPLFRAVEAIRDGWAGPGKVILLDPAGRPLDAEVIARLSAEPRLLLICGRYEGVDERVREEVVDEEISIGDYVLSGGELPAMVLIDTLARRIPGVVGKGASVEQDSFENRLLDHPHYTRPAEYRGLRVPEVLLSGHHGEIESWRRRAALELTRRRRPDLFTAAAAPSDRAGGTETRKT
ncbi:MAG: tRNA (guanosine(37)-N1)-methyltransferase TrmD [Acidobacteriota bacterium]|nr:tRNA (guanosine(37)-N1)-methyltransferase TrmD [Acidobacteriota bacterium]MDQ7086813.1 tRNA (guanosine(37)-N1)-methyltransferase TrmD [Acidobacteriota bacterium]